jgi:hypothetical protein
LKSSEREEQTASREAPFYRSNNCDFAFPWCGSGSDANDGDDANAFAEFSLIF